MVKWVIFDFDGTLVDSLNVVISTYNMLAEKHHFKKLRVKDINRLKKMSVIDRCKALRFPLYKLPLFVPEFYKEYQRLMGDISFFKGIKELLLKLKKKGYLLAIVSSNSEHTIRKYFKQQQMDCFDQVLCSKHIFGKHKLIRKFLKMNRLVPHEAVYLGDEARDIVACKKTGVPVIWAGWGYEDRELAKKELPNYMAQKPEDVIHLL